MIRRKLVAPIAAAVAATALSLGSGNAVAAIMCDALAAPVPVPQTTAGIYVNFVTNVINVSPAATPGWDFNPFSSTAFSFFWPTTTGSVGAGLLTGGKYAALAAGVAVDATGIYSTASGTAITMADWRLGATNMYAGIRIFNEGASATNYAWVQLTTTGPTTGLPASIIHYCYQDDGSGILTGDNGVPPLVPPTVAKSFAPASVMTNTDSTATITLTNPNASVVTLSADLVDTLPAGLVTSGAASTTCTGTASSTSGTLTLGTGATIPASGSCTLTSAVQAATAGSYINAIAAGALQTDAGNNAATAIATLTVTPPPFCSGIGLDEIFCDDFEDPALVAGEDNVAPGLMAIRTVY